MKIFYSKSSENKNRRKVKQCKTFLTVVYPSLFFIFIGLFWFIGLINYFQ